jgi:hypothetical protein
MTTSDTDLGSGPRPGASTGLVHLPVTPGHVVTDEDVADALDDETGLVFFPSVPGHVVTDEDVADALDDE